MLFTTYHLIDDPNSRFRVSSQDSIEGVDVATQLQQYTDLIASRPFSVLPLHHDTKGMSARFSKSDGFSNKQI